MDGIKVSKFVSWPVDMTQEDAEKHALSLQAYQFTGTGIYKFRGYAYDARNLLKVYIIRYAYGGYGEAYAINVKTLREYFNLSRGDMVEISPFTSGKTHASR